jgi:arylsulfatase A-like enzyme
MKRTIKTLVCVLSVLATSVAQAAKTPSTSAAHTKPNSGQTERLPNIIVVMPDDMGYGDLGVTGNPVIRTPHIDRFASESAELTHFYVSPVCSPTRAALMTGRYNYRTRVIDTFKGRSMMEPDEVTVAEALQQAGYTTGIFGKWHLGDNHPLRPQEQGFDEVLIHRGGGLGQPSEPIANQKRYTDPILFRNGKQVQGKGYCTDIYFTAAMKWIESVQTKNKEQRTNKPFFVYLPPNAPHSPYHDVPEKLLKYYQSVDLDPVLGKDKSDRHRDTVARVFAMVENIDQNMGRLEEFLTKSGLKPDTLVIFLTDNGPNTRRYVGPFRGMKTEVHDGGIRSFFYARWPGQLKAGHRNDRIAAHIDLMPTVLAAAGVSKPKNVRFDGRNVLPLLQGTPKKWKDRTLILQAHRGDQPIAEHHIAIRSQQWKLVHPTTFHKSEMAANIPFELYRIMKDVGERDNLAKQRPEQVKKMRGTYTKWLTDIAATRKDTFAPPLINIGVKAEPKTDLSLQDWRVPNGAVGWGDGGSWLVNIKSPGSYAVEVRFAEAPGARQLDLRIGDQRFPAKLQDQQTSVSINAQKLPLGHTTVQVRSNPPFQRKTSPRFVTFQRK